MSVLLIQNETRFVTSYFQPAVIAILCLRIHNLLSDTILLHVLSQQPISYIASELIGYRLCISQ